MTIIFCQSHRRATYEFDEFVKANKPLIENLNHRLLRVKLSNGFEYQFMSEQESEQKLKGTHADEMYIDGFLKEQKNE